jgi:hypothetical protein
LPGAVLYVEAKCDGTEAAVILVGEFDMTGIEPFWGAVGEVLGTRAVAVTVEARGLTFIDSSGVIALVAPAMRPPSPAWRLPAPGEDCAAALPSAPGRRPGRSVRVSQR